MTSGTSSDTSNTTKTDPELELAEKAYRDGYQRGYLDALNIRPPLHPCVESPVWAGQRNSPKQSETRS